MCHNIPPYLPTRSNNDNQVEASATYIGKPWGRYRTDKSYKIMISSFLPGPMIKVEPMEGDPIRITYDHIIDFLKDWSDIVTDSFMLSDSAGFNELSKAIHHRNLEAGYYETPGSKSVPQLLCLIHSEVSEALEADRRHNYAGNIGIRAMLTKDDQEFMELYESHVKGSFDEELSDIIIRVLGLAFLKGIDIDRHIQGKLRYTTLKNSASNKAY